MERWLEQHIPAQIEWHTPNDQPQPITSIELIDETKWQVIQQVQKDYKAGLRITTLAKKYQLSRGTIYKYLKKQTLPSKQYVKPSHLIGFILRLKNAWKKI